MTKKVPFIKPKLPPASLIAQDLEQINLNNYYSNNGPFYHAFKEKIEAYLGDGIHAVIVSNATAALMIAMKVVFGDKSHTRKKYIAVPSFTFAASPLAIHWRGYEPLFVDVRLGSGQPDLEKFDQLDDSVKKDIAGVVLVNNFGIGMEDLDKWSQYLNKRNIPFIIDSAPGFGSTYPDGSLLGGGGKCEIFSFHATKPFGIGEGGLLTTKDHKLAEAFERLKNFGFDDHKDIVEFGMNAKITELDCAIGLRVLENYEETLKDRRRSYRLFEKHLFTETSFLPRAETAAIQFATVLIEQKDKYLRVLRNLRDHGVEAKTYYAPPLHHSKLFRDSARGDMFNTDTISQQVISLPVHPDMSSGLIRDICGIVKEA